MDTAALLITLAGTCITACAFTAAEMPVVRGAILATGVSENRMFKVLLPLIAAAALAVPQIIPLPGHGAVRTLFAGADAMLFLQIALACAITVIFCSRISEYTSPVLAATGAAFGSRLLSGQAVAREAGVFAAVWVAAPLVAAILALVIFKITHGLISHRTTHLLRLDVRVKAALFASAVLLLAAVFFNLAPLPGAATAAVFGPGTAATAACLLCMIIAYLLPFNQIRIRSWEFADRDLDISGPALLAVLLASALVLSAAPVPLSPVFIILSAMAGVSLSGDEILLERRVMTRTALSAAATLAVGFLLGYGFNFGSNPRGMLAVAALLLCIFAVDSFLRVQKEKELQRSIILSREQQIESNRRSLTALEVRSEMEEQDLTRKLELKRRQLVDFALGIGDQKKFMESLYAGMQDARAAADPSEKDRIMDGMLGTLRERMYFTREMNDFYAQSEVLHKDFNIRLRERFPNLTENEHKLANLLRQGFSSKYIASLMNITPKSVEINRYRLRARLGLTRKDNLTQFIKNI